MNEKSILIVDDDKLSRTILKNILGGAGYKIYESQDGDEALKLYRRILPDMVILDVVMPGLSGFDLLRILRDEEENQLVPVILLTSSDNYEEKLRGLELGADAYITKPFNEKELLAQVKNLFQRIEHNRMANPLTGLRGNIDIKYEIRRRIKNGLLYAVLYIDLDNFKSFNDYYGFSRGDKIIRQTARILKDALFKCGNPNDFLGHIGGDDFIIITTPDKIDDICNYIINTFDEDIKRYYDDEDLANGYIEVINRRGEIQRFPIVSISIAVVTNENRNFDNELQISAVAAEIKRKLKSIEGSKYLKDRRKC
ncbi:response regulator [Thermoanaerobacterium sp. R66]|uniref:GGDEF domain-containing response regulator n=1 Tax=Thermoanaerobacterium sp. R66 TaxID=2742479 RepID=UPI00238055C4|nr:response regulator [Thermoanaerobacterium sp. R66]